MLHQAADLFFKLIMAYFSITDQKGGYQQKQSYQRGTFSIFSNTWWLSQDSHSYPLLAN